MKTTIRNVWQSFRRVQRAPVVGALTPSVKTHRLALLIVIAVVLVYGGWVLHEWAKSWAPVVTDVAIPGYNGGFAGVGIHLEQDDKSSAVRISKIIPDSPAALARLSPGLVIEEIDGVTTHSKSVPECQMRIHGKAGTKVRLKLVSPDGNETNVVELTRGIWWRQKQP